MSGYNNALMLTEDDRKRIVFHKQGRTKPEYSSLKFSEREKAEYYLLERPSDTLRDFSSKKEIFSIYSGKAKIMSVFRLRN